MATRLTPVQGAALLAQRGTQVLRGAGAVLTAPWRALSRTAYRAGRSMGATYREAAFNPELSIPSGGVDSDDHLYSRLTSSIRDLNPVRQNRMLEIGHWLYKTNPLAHRVIDLGRDFTIGDGVSIQGSAPDVVAYVKRFWADPTNNLDVLQDQIAVELALSGEIIIPVDVNEINGHVTLGWMDPSVVKRVIMDPANARIPVAVVTGGNGVRDRYFRVIGPERDPTRPGAAEKPGDAGLLTIHDVGDTIIDATKGKSPQPYEGNVFLFQINKSPAGSRGTSDLLHLADWIDAFDQMLWNQADREAFLHNFIWDVTIQGADESTIANFLRTQGEPKPGTVRVHNQDVEWKAVNPGLNSSDASERMKTLLNHVMGGAGMPAHWYGAADDVNRATAKEMSEPVMRRLRRRQIVLQNIFQTLNQFAVSQAILYQQLDSDYPIVDASGEPTAEMITALDATSVVMPELSARDTSEASTALVSTVRALALAQEAGWLTEHTARETFALVARGLGASIDPEDERSALENESPDESLATIDDVTEDLDRELTFVTPSATLLNDE